MDMNENLRNRLIACEKRFNQINKKLFSEEIIKDKKQFQELSKESAFLKKIVDSFNDYKKIENEINDALLISNDEDTEFADFGKNEYKRLIKISQKLISELNILLLPHDPNDDKNIIIEIKGAVGGEEANLFANDLYKMYEKYAEKNKWKIRIINVSYTSNGGISNIAFKINGQNVYSKLKYESGSHRVQRVPKTEANGRIHTSIATVLVMPEIEDINIDIKNSDLKIDTYHSQGAGGQNVNKTESAVRITHIPTNIVVSCQMEKSQIRNRETCMKMLKAKIYQQKLEQQQQQNEKERHLKIGRGNRNEKIRTYNFPQNRVTDHRINLTIQKLDQVLNGEIEEIIEALINFYNEQKMLNLINEK